MMTPNASFTWNTIFVVDKLAGSLRVELKSSCFGNIFKTSDFVKSSITSMTNVNFMHTAVFKTGKLWHDIHNVNN